MHHRSNGTIIALACFSLFIGSVLLMPALNAGYNPVDQTISEGVLGPYGFLQVIGLASLATGSLALACCLRGLRAPTGVRVVPALIAFSAACVTAVAIFPTDADREAAMWTGRVHTAAATLAFLANIAAMLWSAHSFRDDHRLAPLAGISFVVGTVSCALLVLLLIDVEPRGLVQRAAVACILGWMIAVSFRLSRAEAPFATPGS